jgi:mevalonate pyrophosphate decarboxylase
LRYQNCIVVLSYKLKHMKTQTIKSVEQDIQLYKYWIEQCKKVLRVAKEYGLSENEIKQNGNSIKRLRLKVKQKETILNNIKNYL